MSIYFFITDFKTKNGQALVAFAMYGIFIKT